MSCLPQRFGTVAGAVAAVFLGGANAFAQSSIAYWSFNYVPTTTTSIDASVRAELADAGGGLLRTSAFMSFANLNFGDGPNSGAGVTAFLGTTTNSTLPGGGTLSSGNALAI